MSGRVSKEKWEVFLCCFRDPQLDTKAGSSEHIYKRVDGEKVDPATHQV